MRNLKRALSLTLASVMLLGMMVVGTSALSFSDADDISNVTAATVLQELEIMVGNNDKFSPNSTVTRAQMAIIICKIMYGNRLNVSSLANETKFDDVPAGSYYAGYVNFAAEQGIISGYGNGKFGPGAAVSTAQAALMLCRALGYFQGGELDNQSWAQNALTATTMATRLKMFDGLTLDTNAPLSRDNVAAMTFNTMTKAVPVMYNDTWKVYYTDSQNVLGGTQFNYLNTWALQNYDLVYKEGTDEFGRPTTQWGTGSVNSTGDSVDAKGDLIDNTVTLRNSFIEVANESAWTYTTKVTWKDLANAIGRNTASGYTWTVNGTEVPNPTWTDGDTAISNDGIETGDGVLTQIYLTTEGETTTAEMFIIPTYVAQVDGDYDADDKVLTLKSLDDDDAVAVPADSLELSADDFDNLASFADGDYVLVTVADDVIQTIEKADVINGDVDAYVAEKNVTLDGHRYTYTKGYTGPEGGYKLNDECDLVMDKYGFVIFAKSAEADADYVYVNDSGKLQGVGGGVEVELILADGSKVTTEIHKDSVDNGVLTSDNWDDGEVTQGWYKYTMKGGKYVLDDDDDIDDVHEPAASVDITKSGQPSVVWGADANKMAANSGTTFIVKRGDTITVYNGVREVPDISTKDTGVKVHIIKDGDFAKYVLIVGTKDNLSSTSTATSERIFIADATRVENRKDGDTELYVYEAVVNGVVRTITSTASSWEVGLYTDISYDGSYVEDGALVDDNSEDDVKAFAVDGVNLNYSRDVLTWNGESFTLASNCKLWTTDGDDLKSVTATKLANDYKTETLTGIISLVIEDNQVIEVYVDTSEHEGGGGGGGSETITTTNGTIAAAGGTNGAYTVEVPSTAVNVGDNFNVTVKCGSVDSNNTTDGEVVTVTYNGVSKKVLFTAANSTGQTVSFECAEGQTAVTASVAAATVVNVTASNITASAGSYGAYTVAIVGKAIDGMEFTVSVTCTSIDSNNSSDGETVTVTYNGENKTVSFTTAGGSAQTVKFEAAAGQTSVSATAAATPPATPGI